MSHLSVHFGSQGIWSHKWNMWINKTPSVFISLSDRAIFMKQNKWLYKMYYYTLLKFAAKNNWSFGHMIM